MSNGFGHGGDEEETVTQDFGKYSEEPESRFSSSGFTINKNLNLPSNYKKQGSTPAEVEDLLIIAGDAANNDRFKVNVPSDAGGAGVDITVRVVTGDPSDGTAYEVQVGLGSAETTRNRMVAAFNGVDTTVVKYGSGAGNVTDGIAGINASNGRTVAELTITAAHSGSLGNDIVFTDIEGTIVRGGSTSASPANLSGGTDIELVPVFTNTSGPATLRNRTTPYKVTR